MRLKPHQLFTWVGLVVSIVGAVIATAFAIQSFSRGAIPLTTPLFGFGVGLAGGALGFVTAYVSGKLFRSRTTVFVSGSKNDQEGIDKITRYFGRLGYTVKSYRDIHVGDNIAMRITELISESNVMIMLYTQSAARSRWIQLEVDAARKHQVPLLPIVVGSTPVPTTMQSMRYLATSTISEETCAEVHRAVRRIAQQKHGTGDEQSTGASA